MCSRASGTDQSPSGIKTVLVPRKKQEKSRNIVESCHADKLGRDKTREKVCVHSYITQVVSWNCTF